MEFALFTRVVSRSLARCHLCLVFGFVWIWSDLFLALGLLVPVEVSHSSRNFVYHW